MSDSLAFALGYRKLGFSPIPIKPGAKRPQIEWTEYQKRIATPEAIRAWYAATPEAGVGIVCGEVSDDLVVLDVDPRHGGMESLMAAGKMPDTPTVKTGGGGLHYYLRGKAVSRPIAPGLDIRATGGQVVAPPSLHPDTHQAYTWFPGESLSQLERAPMPAWLITLASKQITPEGGKGDSDGWIVATLRGVIEGQRDSACIRLAGYLRSKHLPRDIAMAIMERWARDCHPVFEPDMVLKTVNSAYKYQEPASTTGKGLDL